MKAKVYVSMLMKNTLYDINEEVLKLLSWGKSKK